MRASPIISDTGTPAISLDVLRQWWVAFAASSVFVVSGHLLIKAGLNGLASLPASSGFVERVLQAAFQPLVFTGLVVYLFGSACWIKAVSQKEISFLYPLSSVNYVLVAMAGVLFFHESMSLRRGGGVALIVVGMILMSGRRLKGGRS